jgi:hypothetical protein
MRTFCVVAIMLMLEAWFIWGLTGTPGSGAQIRKVCASHKGVASIGTSFLGTAPIVCRDGWAGYQK